MFGKKSRKRIEVSKLSSLVANDLHIVGNVMLEGGLRVDGKIEGNVTGSDRQKSLIVLGEKGCVVGNVKVHDAIINGTIIGDLEVEHFLELQSNTKIVGNIYYHQLQMECGATVEGKVECLDKSKHMEIVDADSNNATKVEFAQTPKSLK